MSCPDGGYLVELISPSSGNKLTFCQTSKNGQLLKHGPYHEYSAQGMLLAQNHYEWGILKSKEVKPVANLQLYKMAKTTGTIHKKKEPKLNISLPTLAATEERPSMSYFHESNVGFAIKKSHADYEKEYRDYAKKKILEYLKTSSTDKNEFGEIFEDLGILDRTKLTSFIKHFAKQIENKSYKVYDLKVHPLLPFLLEVENSIRKQNLQQFTRYYQDFEFPMGYNRHNLAPVVNLLAQNTGPTVFQMLQMAYSRNQVELDLVGSCFVRGMTKCDDKNSFVYCTPLDLAAKYKNAIMVKFLLERGADPNGQSASTNTTPLGEILRAHDTSKSSLNAGDGILLALLAHEKTLVDKLFKLDGCPLVMVNSLGHAIGRSAHNDFIHYQLQKGTSLDSSIPSPLSAVLNYPHKGGANDKKGSNVRERLEWLRQLNYPIKEMIEKNDGPLRQYIAETLLEPLEYIDEMGIDVNRVDDKGRTLAFHVFDSIHWESEKQPKAFLNDRIKEAAWRAPRRLQILKYLFSHKGKRQIYDSKGKGMIYYANLESPYSDHLVDFLKESGSF